MSQLVGTDALASELRLADLERSLRYRWLTVAAAGRAVVELVPADTPASPLPTHLGVRFGFAAPATPWFPGVPVVASHVGGLVDPVRLPFADGEVAVLVCFDGLARMAHPIEFLDEVKRVLGDGGVFVASTRDLGDLHRLSGPGYPVELLLAQVERRFANTAVLEERLVLASLLAPEGVAGDVSLSVPPLVGVPRSVVVTAGDGPLPDAGATATADDGGLFHAWLADVERLAGSAHAATAELARRRVETTVIEQTAMILGEGVAGRRRRVAGRLRRVAGRIRRAARAVRRRRSPR